MQYLAFVMPQDPGFGFSVPDVEGFTTLVEDDDLDKASKIATEQLAAHLAEIVAAGEVLPQARSLPEQRRDPALSEDWGEAQCFVMLKPDVR